MMHRPLKISLVFATGLITASLLLSGCNMKLVSAGRSSESAKASIAETSQAAETTLAPSETPSPSPTAPASPTPSPALPADPIADAYFGPLPTPKEVKPYTHNELRAIYLGAAANTDSALAIARNTEVNAVVIDLKESDGVKYKSQVPLAIESGVVRPAYNLPKVIEKFHAENVKVIGRIVCFKDPMLAEARPDLAIQDKSKHALLYKLEGKKPFVNPYNQVIWQYNVDLAKEAIAIGVDEIQFDYIRFPTGGTTTGALPYFGEEGTVPSKVSAINRFLQFARIQIQEECGVPLGADVFATIIISTPDGNKIGQDWASLGLVGIDNVSPMIYPSHYANSSTTHYTGNGTGQKINGTLFAKPDLFPYDVMFKTLSVGQKAVAGEPNYNVTIRPYLQAFTASYLPSGYYMTYDTAAIREQIKAIRDAGYKEWVCWNSRANYSPDIFDPQT